MCRKLTEQITVPEISWKCVENLHPGRCIEYFKAMLNSIIQYPKQSSELFQKLNGKQKVVLSTVRIKILYCQDQNSLEANLYVSEKSRELPEKKTKNPDHVL